MAHFTIDKEKELMDINWDKNQKGKKIGSGHFGDVFEVKDNPKYVLKVPKFPNQYYGSTTDEMRKFDSFGDADIVAPSFHSTQGIVRDNLKIVSRGATKQDWDNKTKGLSGYTVFNILPRSLIPNSFNLVSDELVRPKHLYMCSLFQVL